MCTSNGLMIHLLIGSHDTTSIYDSDNTRSRGGAKITKTGHNNNDK